MHPNKWDKIPPYWAVHTGKQEHRQGPTPEFWKSGEEHVQLLSQFTNLVSPILDFGCGTGRLSRALVALGHTVISYDHSSVMRNECRRNVPQARVIDSLSGIGATTCISMITIQHIPPDEFSKIWPLLSTIPNIAMHVTTRDNRPLWKRLMFRLSYQPGFAQLSNLLRRRAINEPRIPMFIYPNIQAQTGLNAYTLSDLDFRNTIIYRRRN